MINKAFSDLFNLVKSHVNLAKDKGDIFVDDFKQSKEYIETKMSLHYLNELQLLSNSEELLQRLENMTEKWSEMLIKAKLYKSMNVFEKKTFDMID